MFGRVCVCVCDFVRSISICSVCVPVIFGVFESVVSCASVADGDVIRWELVELVCRPATGGQARRVRGMWGEKDRHSELAEEKFARLMVS